MNSGVGLRGFAHQSVVRALGLLTLAACLSAAAPAKPELAPRPDPILCLVEWFNVDDDGWTLGCPPDPEPLLGDRPCAADDGRFTRRFVYDADGRPTLITAPTRADGLKIGGEFRFVYDSSGRLRELRGILPTPTVAPVHHERDRVRISFVGTERRFELEGYRLRGFSIWLVDGPKRASPLVHYRFQDFAAERTAKIELPGPPPLTVQWHASVRYVDNRPRHLTTVLYDGRTLEREFVYEGSRLVRIDHGTYRTTVHYDCATPQDAGR